jgi:HPr kinase/phosphorylase
MLRVHGTSVAIGGDGLLLRGLSGSGKSDLALRLIDAGARLVSDDQTELRRDGNDVIMQAPQTIAGRIEVRGVGILRVPTVSRVPLSLVVDLVDPDRVERLPEPQFCEILQRSIPLLALAPFEASTPAKIRHALAALEARAEVPILAPP